MLLEVAESNPMFNWVLSDVIKGVGVNADAIKYHLAVVTSFGCSLSAPDSTEFFNTFRREINAIIYELACEMGEETTDFVASLKDWDGADFLCEGQRNKSILAKLAYEYACQEFLNALR